jgi:protein-L-isoaspartate(D-aspartate) O-methyltransferase
MSTATQAPPPGFAAARDFMVDGQLRPSKVTDRRILDAMRRLPREDFVPPAMAGQAYIDADVPVAPGRVLLKPLVIARLIQLARPRAGENALVVGSGTGYGAAVLAACGMQVTALEEDPALMALAHAAAASPDTQITFVQAPLAGGHPSGAPYDLVLIEGAVRDIPETLAHQVAGTGRLVCIIWPPGASGYAALAEPSSAGLRAQAEFDATAPLLAPLSPLPAFSF